jgi:trans-aconitate 2-methyltransferase
MPANFDHATHAVAAEVAAREPYRSAMGGHVREIPVLALEAYSALLHQLGFVEQHVRMQVYAHLLCSRDDCVEWVRGTLLTDYQKRMPADLFGQFLAEYRATLLPQLPDDRPFFYPFKRILLWGRK